MAVARARWQVQFCSQIPEQAFHHTCHPETCSRRNNQSSFRYLSFDEELVGAVVARWLDVDCDEFVAVVFDDVGGDFVDVRDDVGGDFVAADVGVAGAVVKKEKLVAVA